MQRNESIAEHVYRYLLNDYPEDVLGWVKTADWHFYPKFPIRKIAYRRRPGGRDDEKVRSISIAMRHGKKFDPVVLVDIGNKMTVADGFHRVNAAKRARISEISAFVATDARLRSGWHDRMHDAKLNKSEVVPDDRGDAGDSDVEQFWKKFFASANTAKKGFGDGRTPDPIVPMASGQKKPSRQVDEWGADSSLTQGKSVIDCYREELGSRAKDSVRISGSEHYRDGIIYTVEDGTTVMKIFAGKNGPARVLHVGFIKKSLSGTVPAPNLVWAALAFYGEPYAVDEHGNGRVHNAKITIEPGKFSVEGPRADEIMKIIVQHIAKTHTSEDELDSRQNVGAPSMTAKPW